jgi:uncharacterized protein YqgC (DUF456 family)
MTDTANVVALIVALIIMLIGLAGIVLPVLPGTVLIFVGALIYAIVEGFQSVGWPTLLVLGLLTLVATGAELWTSSLGAKAGGASGWSLLAGLAGGLVGMVFFSLPGALVGAVLGVLLGELVRVRDWRRALKAGGGWAVGWFLSVVVQLVIGLAMVAVFVWQVKSGP